MRRMSQFFALPATAVVEAAAIKNRHANPESVHPNTAYDIKRLVDAALGVGGCDQFFMNNVDRALNLTH